MPLRPVWFEFHLVPSSLPFILRNTQNEKTNDNKQNIGRHLRVIRQIFIKKK